MNIIIPIVIIAVIAADFLVCRWLYINGGNLISWMIYRQGKMDAMDYASKFLGVVMIPVVAFGPILLFVIGLLPIPMILNALK